MQLTPLAAPRGRPRIHESDKERKRAYSESSRDQVRLATALRVRAHREKKALEARDEALAAQLARDKLNSQAASAGKYRRKIAKLTEKLTAAREELSKLGGSR